MENQNKFCRTIGFAEFLRPFGSMRIKFERGNSAERCITMLHSKTKIPSQFHKKMGRDFSNTHHRKTLSFKKLSTVKSFFNFQLNNCQLSIVNCQLLSAYFSVSSPNLPRCYPVATPFLLRSYLEPCGLLSRCFSVTSPNLLAYIKVCIFFLPPCYNFVTVLLSPCYPVP